MCLCMCCDVYMVFVCVCTSVYSVCVCTCMGVACTCMGVRMHSFDKAEFTVHCPPPHLLILVSWEDDPRLRDENQDKLHEVGDKLETEGGEAERIPHSMLVGEGEGEPHRQVIKGQKR